MEQVNEKMGKRRRIRRILPNGSAKTFMKVYVSKKDLSEDLAEVSGLGLCCYDFPTTSVQIMWPPSPTVT